MGLAALLAPLLSLGASALLHGGPLAALLRPHGGAVWNASSEVAPTLLLARTEEVMTLSSGVHRNCKTAPIHLQHRDDPPPQEAPEDALGALGRGSSFLETPPVPIPNRPPKLALLMTVRDQLYNTRLWLAWLRDAEKQGLKVKVAIHTSAGLVEEFPEELKASVVPKRVAVERCNAFNATMLLIGHALQDEEVTHLMTVSDDSIPVKPLKHIYWKLKRRPLSRLCTDDAWYIPRAETWWLLRRGDAQLFYENRDTTFLQTFRYGKAKLLNPIDCDDENFYYLPLKTRKQRWDHKHEVKFANKCVMYTDWSLGEAACKAWGDHARLCDCKNLGQHVELRANAAHPAAFGNISGMAFLDLLRSPFWFARKILSHSEAAAQAAEEAWEAYSS